ncbi:hypothetical protein AGR8A_Lc40233 [Agrobacterium fabrum str. J-07]|nr:hypothetical protein AGR8A_Lc40233 [Agrobacterium fabrum str. J-07]
MNLDVAVLDIPCDWKPRKSATGGMLRPVGGSFPFLQFLQGARLLHPYLGSGCPLKT